MRLRGSKANTSASEQGIRRSRSWQGFGSGLRYESVTDAGLPPPPRGPPQTSLSPARLKAATSR